MARVVYVGLLFEGSSAAFRACSLEQLGHEVSRIEGFPAETGWKRVLGGVRRRTGFGPPHAVNQIVLDQVQRLHADVLWVDKGLNITPSLLASVRRAKPGLVAIHYSLDDYRIPTNTSLDLRRGLALYDVVATTKSYNLEWLRQRGAARPLMTWQGFDQVVHRPPEPGEADPSLAGRIVLVGAWEPQRAAVAEGLAAAGLPVTVLSVWRQWEQVVARCPSLEWRRWQIYGRSYALALGSAALALGVLRKAASDLHTQRSVEIPACGTALLAERTSEHSALFKEGEEAEFYSSMEECIDKAKRLLADPVRRRRIADAGRARCLAGGYSWTDRVRQILAEAGIS